WLSGLLLGNLNHAEIAFSDLVDQEVAKVAEYIAEYAAEIPSVTGQIVNFPQGGGGIAFEHRPRKCKDLPSGGEAEHRKDIRFFDAVAAEADQLFKRTFGVAHAALRTSGNGM